MSEPVIRFDHVSRRFALKSSDGQSWLSRLWNRSARPKNEFWALRDVSFAVKPGEAVGIIGENGSGKSTILKLVTRVLPPSSGQVYAQGRIGALIELGAGFHPELTGRENVFLNGSLLGLSDADIRRQFDSIVEFSELQPFIDVQVKHYSSGMYLRLAFAVAAHVWADILVIDEILAVGDFLFQRKCLERIYGLRREGATLVYVSHDLDSVRNLCERCIWLEAGQVQREGPTHEVVDAYISHQLDVEKRRMTPDRIAMETGRWGSREAEILDVHFLDGLGRPVENYHTGDTFTARIYYRAPKRLEGPVFGTALYRADGLHISGPNTDFSNYPIPYIEGEGWIDFTINALPLLEGNYHLSAVIYDSSRIRPIDHQHMRYGFTVVPGGVEERYGLLYIPSRWEHHRGGGWGIATETIENQSAQRVR